MTFDDDDDDLHRRRPDDSSSSSSSSSTGRCGGDGLLRGRRHCWWSSLPAEVECPITLEPIRSLPYPPFVLVDERHREDEGGTSTSNTSNTSTSTFHYFDGMALASYVVSRGTFHNPLTREPLGRDDCIRLDEHLDRFHYGKRDRDRDGRGDHSVPGGGDGRINVAEAHALRESLRVRTSAVAASAAAVHSDDSSSSVRRGRMEAAQAEAEAEAEARRIEALRSEAAAALRGLFTCGSAGGGDGNPSSRPRGSGRGRNNRGDDDLSYVDVVTSPGHRHPGSSSVSTRPAVPSVGFDLNARRGGGSRGDGNEEDGIWSVDVDAAVNRVDGLRIVDDSLVVGEAADEDEWDEVQRSFPRLIVDDDATAAVVTSRSATDEKGGDGEMLRIARETAERTRLEEERRRAAIDHRRLIEERAAAHRREERARRKVELRTEETVEHQGRLSRERELELARAEIDRWREGQWRRWLSAATVDGDGEGCDGTAAASSPSGSKPEGESSSLPDASNGGEAPVKDVQADCAVEDPTRTKKEEREAAKRAAKRKKARERQKLKKKAEAVERERLKAEEELRARKDRASLRCASCRGGIVDGCGFEKFGERFCSTRCARSGPSKGLS